VAVAAASLLQNTSFGGLASFADGSGLAHQEHVFRGVNSARWWCVYPLSSTDPHSRELRFAWSTDLVTWTDAASVLLASPLSYAGVHSTGVGISLATASRNISSTDVVHVGVSYASGNGLDAGASHSHFHLRATLGAGTVTVTNAEAQVGSTATGTYDYAGDGNASGLDSAGKPYDFSGFYGSLLGHAALAAGSNADAGSSWTAGFAAPTSLKVTSITTKSRAVFDLGSAALLTVYDNGVGDVNQTALDWSKFTGTWSADTSAGFGAATFDYRDWGAVLRTTTDVHVVLRTGATTYEHRRFNGTSWAAGQAVPTQASKATAGLFTASDGTDVWLFCVDSDAANTVRYVKWSGGSSTWGTWAAFESSTQVRTSLAGYRTAVAGVVGVCWTEAASPFRVVTKPLVVSAAPAWEPYQISQYAGFF
jgi:hypothetical protein